VFEAFSIFPFPFWVVIGVLVTGAVLAIRHLHDASGLPMLAVLGTVAFWYVGDAYYNDYANFHAKLFEPDILRSAWWQVAWFLVVFLFAAPFVHQWFNARHLHRTSGVLQMFQHGINHRAFQRQLTLLLQVFGLIWAILTLIALVRLKGAFIYYLFPFGGFKPEPWGRGRLGTGFDALLSVAYYFSQLVAAVFGVVAALSTRRSTRWLALAGCLLSWPFFVLDRARNSILSVVLPGILSWALLRLRGGVLKKAVVLGACFLLVNAWMGFVIANRTDLTIVEALKEKGFSIGENQKVHHEGLNMYEELCWINTFMAQGTYNPNWGSRYFADLVNPIPRVLWPGKPMVGIDYAIARGQGGADESTTGGAYATISTGLIGQGVVNFGRFIGPAFAALLMSFWVAILARLDLHVHELGRLPLYATGLFVTFNVGRDLCFIAVYPFVFGYIMIRCLDYYRARQRHPASHGARPTRPLFALKTKSVKMWGMNRKVVGIGGRARRMRNVRSPAKWRKNRPRVFRKPGESVW
jgi:hypothetical protein